MRQNKQSVSLSINFRRWLSLAFVVGLCLAAVVSFERARAQQPAATPAPKARTKRITPLRTSDTADGSRVTITSDGELNDYSAYRSGDRFIVVVPQAEGAGGGGARGRGFEGAQVEKRGKDLVYTFKLQPGATARVNQRFNRLDVQFSAPKGANASNAVARPTPSPTPSRRTPPEEAGIVKPPTNANAQPTPDARRTPDVNANNAALAAATPFVIPTPDTAAPTPGAATTTPTLAPTPATPGADQIAQAQPSIAPPTSITTGAPSTTTPTSVGAVVTRNWPWLLAVLLVVGIGLFFVSRFSGGDRDQSRSLPPAAPADTKPVTVKETKTAELKPSSVSTNAATGGALGGATTASGGAIPAATAGATAAATGATAANLATSGKQSKKKKKKAEKAKRLSVANEPKTADAKAATTSATTTEATTADATTKDAATGTGGAIVAAGAMLAGASVFGGATETAESEATETKAIEAVATESKAVEPPVAFDPERIEGEIRKLLAGESYDESIINTTDEGTRQLVSAELMQAVAGRNAARQAHARTAFLRHGYFEEATRALQSAEAPGERASAARTLGIFGDRSATPHLTAALEDPSADVRRTTVEALAELRDPAAVNALEALRWRETSRQVPRTLIQRAIEASKVEEEEAAAPVVADKTPTPVADNIAASALAAPEIQKVGTTEIETKETATPETVTEATVAQETVTEETGTKELELAYATPVDAEVVSDVAESPVAAATEEADATDQELTVESPSLAATETAAPVVEEAATVEPVTDDEETKAIEVLETEAFAFNAPRAESTPAPYEPTVESETGITEAFVPPAESDLAATLAAKEASIIEARKRESERAENADAMETAEPLAATPHTEPQPVYRSDFATGSGHPGVGDDDWIDLDADDQALTVQRIEPDASTPAEPLGTFYAEDAREQPAAHATAAPVEARRDETDSLFDTLEIEAFETNAIEPAPTPAPPAAGFARIEEADTKPLVFESHRASAASVDDDELPDSTGLAVADKGLSVADGSDEHTYSIIPKGIQLRLASDDASERAQSVLALSRLNTDEAFGQICEAFDDPAEEVRNAAARAIYNLSEDRADSFTRVLRESPVERRRHIGAALAGSGLAEEAISNLTGESRDKTYDAFSLLFLMAKAGEVAPLIRAIESHHDNEVRLAVVKLLALSGQHEILPSFRRLAVRGSLPAEVRSAVMEAIYQISSQPNATPTAP